MSAEEFGLLGGGPDFIARYLEKAGGWELIREKTGKFWQLVVDDEYWEANSVAHYYKLAGWDNPPQKSER